MRYRLTFIPGWKQLLAVTLPVLLGVGAVAANVPAPAGLLVHVVGAVEHPGLYRMKRGDRVYDAIAAAGGLSVEADITRLPNMAGRLKDGEQVKVPYSKGSSGATVVTRVNLNTATVEELEVVPGFS